MTEKNTTTLNAGENGDIEARRFITRYIYKKA